MARSDASQPADQWTCMFIMSSGEKCAKSPPPAYQQKYATTSPIEPAAAGISHRFGRI
jgi:hypothetical protein